MSDPTVQRRLAAILSADVVGYSHLMGVDEVGTLAALKAHRAELMDPKIAAHAGRIVKTAGDGFLVEFPSIIEAVECAVDLQISTDSRNVDIPEERQLRFRIGINVGDVIFEDGDIFGDGVNVAARLQEIAEPGEVYISRSARDQVRDKLDMPREDLGEHEVKNIVRPVRVFRVGRNDGSSPARRTTPSSVTPAAASHPPDQQSIAVLPFENMSGDQEQEYFADGIAEDIITSLSKISGLFVIARNSTFTYKGQSVNVQEVSQALGVRNVLEGSVRKAGNRVRITAQLIDGASGGHLWAERYDRDLEDIFEVQEEVTQKIVEALEVTLKAGEGEALVQHETMDLACYDCLLRGRELFMRFTKEGNLEARKAFEEALEIDPNCAPAYARLAQTYTSEGRLGWTSEPEKAVRIGVGYANKALEIDKDLPVAHSVLGNNYLFERRHDDAIAMMARWVELDPNEADAYTNLGQALSFSGRPKEALPMVEKAMRLNPSYGFLTLFGLGLANFLLGNHAEAIKAFERSIVHNPDFDGSKIFLGASYGASGEAEKAREAVAHLGESGATILQRSIAQSLPFKREEDSDKVVDGLKKAGIELG